MSLLSYRACWWSRDVFCCVDNVSGYSELDSVNEIVARCEARARSLLAGTIFDDVRTTGTC